MIEKLLRLNEELPVLNKSAEAQRNYIEDTFSKLSLTPNYYLTHTAGLD